MPGIYHIIQRHVFDISYPVRENAFALQTRFSRLFDRQSTPIMQEVLDRLIPDGLILRLDMLTLDLGSIRHDRLEKDFPDRLKQALEKELQRIVQEYTRRELQGRAGSLTELLEYFLLTGSLPWWAAGALLTDPAAIVEQLMGEDPQELRRVLLYTGQHDHVRKRLIHQFPESAVRAMVQVLEPDEAAFIFVYHADIIHVQETQPFYRQDLKEFEKNVWIFIFTYLLVDRGSNFNRKIFVKSTLTQMARQYNMEYGALITLLFRALEAANPALVRRSALSGIIHILFQEEGKRVVQHPPQSPSDLIAEKLSMIHSWLLYGRIPGQPVPYNAPALSEIFTQLITQAPGTAHEMMRSLSEQQDIWARIVRSFDESVVKSLVRLREPEEAEFIFHYAGRLTHLQRQQFLIKTDSSSFYQSIWEVILAFIWTERGNLFNTRRFLEYNIRRISRRHHLSYRELLTFLVQGIGRDIKSERDSSLFHSLAVLLKESEGSSNIDEQLSMTTLAAASTAEWLSALDHYLLHRQWPGKWRLDGQVAETILLQQILQWLFRESPLQLMKMLIAGSLRTHPPINDAARALVQQTIRLLFASTAAARYRVEHILQVAGEEPLRLLITYMGGEILPALRLMTMHLAHPLAPAPTLTSSKPPHPTQTPSPPTPPTPKPPPPKETSLPHNPPTPDTLYIHNAGLILLHPLLPYFLERLGLTQKHQFIDETAQHRSIHLLQYLVDGKSQHPEHQLMLNKILCNIPMHEPVPLEITLSEEEQQMSAELFEVLRQRWPKMQNTSREGIQVSFLQRDGGLAEVQDGWRLRVEEKGIDALLQFLPWSWSMVRLPWMNTTIYTEWT